MAGIFDCFKAQEGAPELEEPVIATGQLCGPGWKIAPVADPEESTKATPYDRVDKGGNAQMKIPFIEGANYLIVT